jgi:hypothetical protein
MQSSELDPVIMFLDIIHCLVFCLKNRPVYISKHSVSEIGTSSVYWTQQSRFYLKMGIESSVPNIVF